MCSLFLFDMDIPQSLTQLYLRANSNCSAIMIDENRLYVWCSTQVRNMAEAAKISIMDSEPHCRQNNECRSCPKLNLEPRDKFWAAITQVTDNSALNRFKFSTNSGVNLGLSRLCRLSVYCDTFSNRLVMVPLLIIIRWITDSNCSAWHLVLLG